MSHQIFKKEFVSIFNKVAYSVSPFTLFSDFCFMCAASLKQHVPGQFSQDLEKNFLSVEKNYSENTREAFPKLFHLIVEALEAECSDFLGSVYMDLGFGNVRSGQFFTPDHITYMMAEMILGDAQKTIDDKGYITIADPCVGAGSMLMSAAKVLQKQKINFQSKALFFGTDIDRTCFHMAYIQLSLIGAPAVLSLGDSLKNEYQYHWETFATSQLFQWSIGNFKKWPPLINDNQKNEEPVLIAKSTSPAFIESDNSSSDVLIDRHILTELVNKNNKSLFG